jgi:hypothetical protein
MKSMYAWEWPIDVVGDLDSFWNQTIIISVNLLLAGAAS